MPIRENKQAPDIGNTPHIVECPRDAMQGLKKIIPTALKIQYLNHLLQVGFDTLDFGSLVSHRQVPQMADTLEVLAGLQRGSSATKLLAIVANLRGAETAMGYPAIHCLGYPFSISETFQKRNTNRSIADSLDLVRQLVSLCDSNQKELVVYISMGFGNPYGDPYSPEIVKGWAEKLVVLGVRVISLADTVGMADPDTISWLFSSLIPQFPFIEFGAHFHSHPDSWEQKIRAADQHGCRRFDSTLLGIGGCPMAKDELVGNIATENLLGYFRKSNVSLQLNEAALLEASQLANDLFN